MEDSWQYQTIQCDYLVIDNIEISGEYEDILSKSKPQPNLNTTVGFYAKMTLHHHHHPPTHRNSMSAIYQLLLILTKL